MDIQDRAKRPLDEDTLPDIGLPDEDKMVDTDQIQDKDGFNAMAKQKNPNMSDEEIASLAALQESVEAQARAARSKM